MREVRVWLLPRGDLSVEGAAAVVVDQLRASSTIVRALAAGAACVRPCPEPADAIALRGEGVVLGGERGGLRIEGFDLGNSPSEYTSGRVAGMAVAFTTTNGTRAIASAQRAGAERVVIGCLNNLSAVVGSVRSARRVVVVCAGTDGAETEEDTLVAGAIADRLIPLGFAPAQDQPTRLALAAWRSLPAPEDQAGALATAMRSSRGGKNLAAIGLGADVDDCAAVDSHPVVPALGADGALRCGS
ncbi:MAG: 2-phosphosulfolactate phosphatase [Phycisphaerales bacterium]